MPTEMRYFAEWTTGTNYTTMICEEASSLLGDILERVFLCDFFFLYLFLYFFICFIIHRYIIHKHT